MGQSQYTELHLGPKEECTFVLDQRTDTFNADNQRWLSSLSVFYQDVYGRAFRSRLLYIWNGQQQLEAVGKEHLANVVLPPTVLSSSFSLTDFNRLEGPRPVLYFDEYLKFHMLTTKDQLFNTLIPGTQFTDKEPLILLDIEFNRTKNEKPSFHVQIAGHRAFIISYSSSNGSGTVIISDCDDYETHAYQQYGLIPDGNDSPQKTELYIHILKTVSGTDPGMYEHFHDLYGV